MRTDILSNKYIILLYIVFIVSFIGLWNTDNIKIKENFTNCPKSYMDKLLSISEQDPYINKNINNYDKNYNLNYINLKTNKSGGVDDDDDDDDKLLVDIEEEDGEIFPKASNYNFFKY